MASRKTEPESSLRSRWLGARMRVLREDRGLRLKYVASYLGVEFGELARLERGRAVFQHDKLALLLELYGVFDQAECDHLLGLARSAFRLPRWQDDFAGPELHASMLDFLWLESVARQIRSYGPVLVPESLRTSSYVEVVLRREANEISDAQVDWWVRTYQDRHQTLDATPGTEVQAVIAESVLQRPMGATAGTLRCQLEHLVKSADSERVQVRVLRAGADYVAGMDGWFTVFDLSAPYPSRIACTGLINGVTLHEDQVADRYAAMFERLWQAALPQDESISMIRRVATDTATEPTS